MISRARFGTLADGRLVEAITLTGSAVGVTVISYGAAIQAVRTPDRYGNIADIVIGYDDLAGYLTRTNYFGSTVGRYANRIAGGRFAIDGQCYQLPLNNGPNSLHGGSDGFDTRLWDVMSVDSGNPARVTMGLVSPDGDQGYPGALTATVDYALDESGALSITFRATTDRPTVVNLTNHAYWNLSGNAESSAMDTILTIPADAYLPVDAGQIPTGEVCAVAETPFDFRRPAAVRARHAQGFDHNWVISRERATEPRLVARAEDPGSGRALDVLSTEPGLQFYSGSFLDGTIKGKGGKLYRQGDGFCLEPQMFPDTPNQPAFGSTRLDPGQVYEHRMIYRFSTVLHN